MATNLAGSKHRAAMFPPARARAELRPNASIHYHAGAAGTRRWTAQRAIPTTLLTHIFPASTSRTNCILNALL